jgi:hypothetical protein
MLKHSFTKAHSAKIKPDIFNAKQYVAFLITPIQHKNQYTFPTGKASY